jgi:hypothetical protein
VKADITLVRIWADGVDKVVGWWAWLLIGALLSVAVRFVCRR